MLHLKKKKAHVDFWTTGPEQMYLDVSVRQQQVDDDIHRKALHVVQPLLNSAQFRRQLHAGVELPSFTDLVQNGLAEILAAGQKNKCIQMSEMICLEGDDIVVHLKSTSGLLMCQGRPSVKIKKKTLICTITNIIST